MACSALGNFDKSSSVPLEKSAISRTDANIVVPFALSDNGLLNDARAARKSAKPVSPPAGGVVWAYNIESMLCLGATQNCPSK